MDKLKGMASGFYILVAGAVLSIVAAIVYTQVMYTNSTSSTLMIVEIVLAAAVVIVSLVNKYYRFFSIVPVINAVLTAYAAVSGASYMVNEIGYVISGLDPMSKIVSFIVYEVIIVLAILLYIVASFLPLAKETEA